MLIDTAGLRRKSKVDENIEKYSVLRSYMAVERADVVLVLIDAREGVTEQDTKIAGYADDLGKACVVVANKWDDVEKETGTMEKLKKDIKRRLAFMDYAPIEFISAMTGARVDKLFPLINAVNAQNCMRIPTGRLNAMLADAVTKVQPPSDKGRRLRLYYITQASVRPPTFVVFVNDKRLFHFSYKRYIENCIRETFGLTGTPIRTMVRERDEKDNR
jgi:GTP-binding protein